MHVEPRSAELGRGLRLTRVAAIAGACAVAIVGGFVAFAAHQVTPLATCGTTYSLTATGVVYNWTSAPWVPTGVPGVTSTNDCASIGQNVQVQLTTSLPNAINGLTIAATSTISGGPPPYDLQVASGGTLTIAATATASNSGILSISGGTITNNGTLTVPVSSGGNILFAGGTLAGSGSTNIQYNNGPASVFSGSQGAMNIDQPLTLSDGTINFTSGANALNINSPGTMVVTSTGLGSFNIQNTAPIQGTGTITIGSGGLLNMSAIGTSTISNPLDNGGTVAVTSVTPGTLSLAGGGTHTGAFTSNQSSNVIDFSGGTHNWNSGTSFTGATGPIEVIGGIANANAAALSIPSLTITSGQLNLPTGVTLTASGLTQSGGTISGPGTLSATQLNWSAGTQNGGGTTKVTGAFFPGTPTSAMVLSGGRTLELAAAVTSPYDTSGTYPLKSPNLSGDGTGILRLDSGMVLNCSATGTDVMQVIVSTPPGGGTVNVNSGNLQLNAGGSFGNTVTINAGTSLILPAGSFSSFNGGSAIAGSGTLSVAGGDLTLNQTTSMTNAAVSGGLVHGPGTFSPVNLAWSGGTLGVAGDTGNVIIPGGGTVTFNPATSANIDHPFTNGGTFTWTGNGTLSIDSSTTFNNAGTLDAQGNGIITCGIGCGSSLFNNTNLFKKTTTAGTTTVSSAVAFNNNGGTVNAQIGTIQLAGGTSAGTFTTTTGTTIGFNAGTHTFNAGTAFTGTGTTAFNGANIVLNTPITPTNAAVSAGTISGSGSFAPTNLAWSGGTLGQPGDTGTVSIPSTGTATLSGGALFLNTRTFANSGAMTITTAGPISLDAGAILSNGGTGTIDDQANTTFTSGASGTIQNGGMFQKTIAAGVTNVGSAIAFNNLAGGTVSGQAGTLQFNGNFSGAAAAETVTAGPTGVVDFAGTTNSLGAGSTVNGAGTIQFGGGTTTIAGTYNPTGTTAISTGATATFNSNATTGTLQMTGGTLNGAGTFTVSGGGTMSAGSISGSGLTLSGGTLNLTGTGGPMTISSPFSINPGATVNFTSATNTLSLFNTINGGTFVVNGNANILNSGTSTFQNNGTFNRTGGSSSFGVAFNNAGTALFQSGATNFTAAYAASYVQNSGATQLFGGTISSASTIGIAGGTLSGVGTIGASVLNSGGSISVGTSPVSTGILTVNGTYTQTAGSLNLKIQGPTAGTQYDQLNATGAVSLNGPLSVTGGYAPTATDTFTVMNFASKSGDFSSKSFPSAAYRASYLPTAAPTTLVLAAPSFDLSATQSGATTAVNGQNAVVTITVTNAGPSSVDATLNGSFSGPASFVSVTATGGGTCSILTTTTYKCSWTTFAATSNTATLTLATSATGTVTTNASVTSSLSPDSNPANDTAAAHSISITPSVDLGVTVTGTPNPVAAGATETYTVKVTNTGLDSSTSADPITVTLTGGTIASTSGAFTCGAPSGTTVSCTMPPILGSGGFITETVTVTAGTGASMTLSATASDANDTNTGNNTGSATTTITATADIAVTQSGPASVIQGQNATIVVTVTNNGPSPATNVTVADAPTNGGVVAATSSQGSCLGSPTWNCNLGTLASGASATATYTVNAPGPSPLTNNASANATESDPVPANNNATPLVITVINTSDIAVSESAAPTSIITGQNAVFTVVVTNNGPSNATNVSVSDSYSGGTFVSVSSTPGTTCSGVLPVTCSIATLATGNSETITLTLKGGAAGTLTNSVTATSPAPDSNAANNSATASVTVGSSADVMVTGSGSPNPVNPGQNATITETIKNLGPSSATNVTLTDSFTGATFVSSAASQGTCSGTTTVTCSIGTLASGATATVTIVLHAGTTSIQDTATVSATEPDPNSGNNSSTVTIASNQQADISVTKSGPATATPGGTVTYTITVGNSGPAAGSNIYVTDPTPTGLTQTSVTGACTVLPCTIASLAKGATATISVTYTVPSGPNAPTQFTNTAFVLTRNDPNQSNNTSSVTTTISCATQPPTLVSPLGTSTVASPVTFSWTAVTNATTYQVFITQDGATKSLPPTTATSATGSVGSGVFSWYVVATTSDCGPLTSNSVTVNACNRPDAPLVSVVANAASGQTYSVQWDAVTGAGSYEVQESSSITFPNDATTTTQTVSGSPVPYTHTATANAQPFFYRVRALASCDRTNASAYSAVVRIVISPITVEIRNPNANVPAGSTRIVVQEIHIPGVDDGNSYTYSATVDRPWLTVAPPNGVLPPLGINLQVSADPSSLGNGTSTGTVIVAINQATGSSSHARTSGTTTVSVPVSISLVTPVLPTNPSTTAANAVIIPSVGHLDGLNSQWQSDIRIANTGFSKQQVVLTFSPTTSDTSAVTSGVKQTTITVDAGATVALDDVAHNWFGVGSLGEAANGVLTARPLTSANAKDTTTQPSISTVVASSRTYSVSSAGTLGQYIPAIPFSSFIGAAAQGQIPTVLSLQQIAQSDAFRTNVGLVEAAGAPAAVTLSVFDDKGTDIKDIPLTINPFQQMQLNAFLAAQGITLTDGRIQVKVTSGTGKVTAYASVVDNRTNDPLLVSGVPLSAVLANRYVLPGVADLNNGQASWRSDVRIFNGGTTPQSATLTLYPLNGGTPLTTTATVNPNEVKQLDSAVQSLFGVTNVGGALHVSTPTDSSLIVTGRTYNAVDGGGTYGQFIPAVTATDAVGNGGRTLQILQVEDSPRFRTNLGIAEVTGQPATAEITVFLPDAKVAPRIDIPLAAYEYRQFPIIQQLGLGNVYNARISINVVGGNGKITAYGSVVDQQTQDPTYVPAQ